MKTKEEKIEEIDQKIKELELLKLEIEHIEKMTILELKLREIEMLINLQRPFILF